MEQVLTEAAAVVAADPAAWDKGRSDLDALGEWAVTAWSPSGMGARPQSSLGSPPPGCCNGQPRRARPLRSSTRPATRCTSRGWPWCCVPTTCNDCPWRGMAAGLLQHQFALQSADGAIACAGPVRLEAGGWRETVQAEGRCRVVAAVVSSVSRRMPYWWAPVASARTRGALDGRDILCPGRPPLAGRRLERRSAQRRWMTMGMPRLGRVVIDASSSSGAFDAGSRCQRSRIIGRIRRSSMRAKLLPMQTRGPAPNGK
jgi:hypothetical protein